MNPTHLLRQFVVVLLLALLALAVLQGCTANPDAPDYDNPFDPDNPQSSDPFDLIGIVSEDQVLLAFDMLDGFGFTDYYVQHRVEGTLSWTNVDTLAPASGRQQYPFFGAAPTVTNYFRIKAVNELGQETSSSTVIPLSVQMPPIIDNLAGNTVALSRFQTLLVAATTGDSIEVSRDSLFATLDARAPRSEDGTTVFTDFDLGPAASDSAITVYARTTTDLGGGLPPILSERGSRTFDVGPAATITLARGGSTIASPFVDLLISNEGAGVDSMRFASSADGLEDQPWQPGAATADDVPVLDNVDSQTLFAQFQRDFGYEESAALPLLADDLTTADFAADLPTNRVSPTPAITLLHDAVATEMRTSQYPDFHDAVWEAYADTTVLVLTEITDQYLYPLFAQYRNHWFESPVRSDFALLGPGEVRVDFTNPLQGLILEGGTTIDITGTAATYDATKPITGVDVHVGDGWLPAAGTENWEYTWDVPLLTADTPWSIGALATAADTTTNQFETGYAWISVTISQLAITISTPTDHAEVTRGTSVGISGTAVPFLAGAPLDSVVVAVPGERLRSPTLETWSVSYNVPEDAVSPFDITAWVYAGEDSVSTMVEVDAVDPPPGR